ncbi:unnamed protein product [Heligmosomoides polygyrus]|uniref:Striatin domain-containing protein n=1 Tax=Heligmosomoides polygyrus TaxID=6339 RepID=A0A3P8B5N0_HELPZ|nr:unnamed protein product [Heligmosomoides polygyrus]
MSEGISKNDLAALFGSKAPKTENVSTINPLSDQNRKDLVKEYYAKTNQSLVMRIHRLEVDLANSRKLVEQLRSENFSLKQKLSDSENRENGEEIEALVNERRKMDRIGYISRRAIAFLQKTAVNLKDAYEDFGIALEVETDSLPGENSESRCRLSSLVADGEPRLEPVSESPCLDLEALKAVGKNDDVVLRFQASETPAVRGCREGDASRQGPGISPIDQSIVTDKGACAAAFGHREEPAGPRREQTNVREVRTVLGEVQQSQLRPRCRKPSDEEEKMDTNTESDTGSMISIIPVSLLAAAQKSGFDVDALEVVPESNMIPVYDASGNRMEFLGAVKMKVEIEGGKGTEVAFHISDVKDEEILLGTNALERLGIHIVLSPENAVEHGAEGEERVVVTRRMYIPAHGRAMVSARCEGDCSDDERVVWPHKSGMAAGVFRIYDQRLEMPVINDSDEPMILKEGEEIGSWGTEKWRERWEDLNPLMMDSGSNAIDEDQRRKLLHEQVRESSGAKKLGDDIVAVLDEFRNAFSVGLTACRFVPSMGNCFSLKHKRKDIDRDHPTVSRWLASCDFSSVPDIDDLAEEEHAPNCVIYDSVLGGDNPEGDCDGYTTAVENMESEEDDQSRDVVGQAAPSSSGNSGQPGNLYLLSDEESIYETSDEQGAFESCAETPRTKPVEIEAISLEGEEDDVVEELSENLVSPRIKLESLVDRRGRVRRSERVQLYLDEKRQSAQRV